MVLDSVLPLQANNLDKLDRFTKLNVLALLGQSIRESRRGNGERAVLYFVTALVALKSMKLSFAIQGVLTFDRALGGLTGSRPLDQLFQQPSR